MTAYSITIGDNQPKTYQRKDAAIEFAVKKAKDLGTEIEVIAVEDNSVAFVATYVEGRYFHPWERVETPKFTAPHFAGYYPAYTRARINTVVYRSYDEENETPWMVWDGRTGGTRSVTTTKAACRLTSEMKAGSLF